MHDFTACSLISLVFNSPINGIRTCQDYPRAFGCKPNNQVWIREGRLAIVPLRRDMGWSRGGVDKRFEINSDMDIIVVVGLYTLILVYLYTETVYISPFCLRSVQSNRF